MEHLPNGFDPGVYRFASRSEARVRLGLPPGSRVIAASCASFENRLKGMPFAIAALRATLDMQPIALLVGQVPADLENQLGTIRHLAPGFVSDRQKLGLYYAAADIILYPSLGDNLPITIQEAMAAATPVLAFDVGGIPELVKHGQTGWLVPVGDQEALNRGLRLALESSETESMGARARAFVTKEYDARHCLERHLRIYRRAMAVPEALAA